MFISPPLYSIPLLCVVLAYQLARTRDHIHVYEIEIEDEDYNCFVSPGKMFFLNGSLYSWKNLIQMANAKDIISSLEELRNIPLEI